MHTITTISPVIAMILMGYLLRRNNIFSGSTVKELSFLVYWVGLPCLLFYKVSSTHFNFAACGKIYFVLLTGLLFCILAAYTLTKVFAVPRESVSAVVQSSFRGNLAFIGLPLLMYSISDTPAKIANSTQTMAVFLLALMVLTNNCVAVMIFLIHQHTINYKTIGKLSLGIVTNPLLISSAAGLIFGRFVDEMPVLLERILSPFSQMVLPLALISVGAAIANQKIIHHFFPALLASFIKLGVYPLFGYLIARYVFFLPHEHMRLAMIFMACPTAAASYILANELGGDHTLTATIIAICTVLSVIPLTTVIYFF